MLKTITCVIALIASLGMGASANSPTYPPSFEAFSAIAQQTEQGWQIDVDVRDGFYLYVKDFQPAVITADNQTPLQWSLPTLDRVIDPLRGEIDVMRHQFSTQLSPAPAGEMWLELQGCADSGFCYPPEKRLLTIISE